MKTILVPTDFSHASENAFRTAVSLAERTGATLKVLHIIEGIYEGDFSAAGTYIPDDGMDSVFVLKLIEKSRKEMHRMLSGYDVREVKVEEEIKVGNVFERISDVIAQDKIDLIIMGMHGKEEKQAGSNTIKVVRKAHCPVLIVKNVEERFAIRKVLLATDFQTINKEYIARLKEFQTSLGFELHILFVNTQLNFFSSGDIESLVDNFKKEYRLDNAEFHCVNDYSEEKGILSFASKIGADIIALTTHGRKGVDLFFFGSISENVVKTTRKPILTFKV